MRENTRIGRRIAWKARIICPARPVRRYSAGLGRLGRLHDALLPHARDDLAELFFGERLHRDAHAIEPAFRRTVHQRGLIIVQEIGDLGGACRLRETHHRKTVVAMRAAERGELGRALRLGENINQHEGLQRDCEYGKGCGHCQSARRQAGEKSGQPPGDGAGNVLARGVGLGIDRGHEPVRNMRRRRSQRFVEVNGLGQLFADEFDLARKTLWVRKTLARQLGILPQRRLDALAVAATQRTRRIPGQQRFNVAGFDILARIAGRIAAHHGQPRSIPATRHNSASFLRA